MIALAGGWSANLSRGCKGDPFCGFDFTWPYETGYSFDLGGLMHLPAVAAEPERFGHWAYAKQAAFFPSMVDAQISPRYADHGLTLPQAARVRLDHFAAYVRGAAGLMR